MTYTKPGRFELIEKPKPEILNPKDAVVRVTLSSICSSDLHILHGAVPKAEIGITVGHELVGVVEAVGSEVTKVKPGDRVAVNVETFCGECFYCKRGYVNNCTSGGWMLGCQNFRNFRGRYRADYWCRTDRFMHAGMCAAVSAT